MSYKVALAGHPNSGKTTLFNALVGADEKIGNWPGTTIEQKEGFVSHQDRSFTVIDLPGTYSLNPFSIDEKIAHDFIIYDDPAVIAAVIDANHLERNLYLVVQILEFGKNVVLSLNMMDLARKKGLKINDKKLSEILNIPVIETAGLRGEGLDDLKQAVFSSLDKKCPALHIDYGDLEESLRELEDFFKQSEIDFHFSLRGAAIKTLQGDADIITRLEKRDDFAKIDDIIKRAKQKSGTDLENLFIERRFAYLKGLVKECVLKPLETEDELTVSDKIDRVVTNRFLGVPIFLFFMYVLFSLVFKVGGPFVKWINDGFSFLSQSFSSFCLTHAWPEIFSSLVTNGIIPGVGNVISFLPYILLLFLGISALEDSGYLARAAFIMDRLMHALGLHGKSFIPMLLGFGCNIPGIMAARTLESQKDRILTILILPLMSCSARLPVYTLFAAAFFPRKEGLVVFSLYLLGIVLAVFVARIFKTFLFKKESAPLVMELPPYRLPHLKLVSLHMWHQAKWFLKRAGTVIFASVILLWALASLPWGVAYASQESLIGKIGQWIAPVFKLAGFGFWQAGVALISGIVAKEVVVSSFGALYGVQKEGLAIVLQKQFTPLSAYAFLVMTLIYIPCIATIAVIKKETNWKWAGLAVGYTLILGWVASVLIYQLGNLILKYL